MIVRQECLFQETKLLVIEWVAQNQAYFQGNGIKVEILRNEKEGYRASFENDICMAEIVVEQPYFAPYRFISFEIAAIKEEQVTIVYNWYDHKNTTTNEIRRNLKKGIDYFIDYI